MKMLTKLSAVLVLISALVSTTAMATLVTKVNASCGDRANLGSLTGYAECNETGTSPNVPGIDPFNWNIRSIATSAYETGGLRTSGLTDFTGLLLSGVATTFRGFGTGAVAQVSDRLTFNFANASPGSTLTMKTKTVFHGLYTGLDLIDKTKFIDNKSVSMRAYFTPSGFGSTSDPEMVAIEQLQNGVIQTFGSTDVANTFTNAFVTVNQDGRYSTSVSLNLETYIQVFNGERLNGTAGIGQGTLIADFSSTAGVVSIDFFDQQGQRVDYTMTTSDGTFALLQAAPTDPVNSVPEPGSNALVLLGLCAVAGFSQRRRSVPAA